MATSKLSLPSRKLFISDVQSSKPCKNTTNISGLNVWEFNCTKPQLSLLYAIVWLQGKVIDVTDGGDCLTLQDQSGILKLEKASNVVESRKITCKGHYILVVGEVIQTGHHTVVKANKIQNLTDDIIAQELWPKEVNHAKEFLSKHFTEGVVSLEA